MSGSTCKVHSAGSLAAGAGEEGLTSCLAVQMLSDTATLTYCESGGLQKRCGNESYPSCFLVGCFPHVSLGSAVLKVRA